jgi:GNAT superfamily N-acetyltransferase
MNAMNEPALPPRFIQAQETWPLRHHVLRPNGTREDCVFPHDTDETTFHLAILKDGRPACIGSFYRESGPVLQGNVQYRLRGMATEPLLRGQGLGAQLITSALAHLRTLHADLLWCNARENAMPFYRKLGFTIHGERFEMPGIGPHYLLSIPV